METSPHSERCGERISALMDGEIIDSDIGHALRDLKDDDELTRRWDRYHLASDAMRNNLSPAIDPGFAQRIGELIDDEPTVLAPRRRPHREQPAWMKQVSGLAVAASVTAAAILGAQALFDSETPGGQPRLANTSATVAPLSAPAARPDGIQLAAAHGGQGTAGAIETGVPQAKFNRLLLNHQEYQAGTTLQHTLPYTRLVYTQP